MGKLSRTKGVRTELELVNLHRKIGIESERVPLSGATGYQNNGQDIDCYIRGRDEAPAVCQVKRNLRGVKGMLNALGDADALFLRYDAEPGQLVPEVVVCMPWRTYERLLKRR